jgi:cytochrome P450/NADPH-cytochrome P450 reductase
MQDVVSQMVLKWARFGPDERIDSSGDFTRLTLDSIAM